MGIIIHIVTEKAPALLPIFRSRNQLELLTHILLHPDQKHSIAAIGRETGIPQPTISREVDRLTKAGLIEAETLGRMKLVRANKGSPYFQELYSLLLKSSGPAVVLRDRLRKLKGLRDAYIFGSWARRYAGEVGDAPADIDLLLIGNPSPTQVDDLSNKLERKLGTEVNPVILSPREWESATTGFVRQVKKQPLVPLVDHD